MASDRETLLGRIRPVMIWAVGESAPLAVCGRCGSVLMDDVEHANRREHEEWHEAIEAPASSSAAPNQTAAELVKDDGLRHRIVRALWDAADICLDDEQLTKMADAVIEDVISPVADSELRDRVYREIDRHQYWHPGTCNCGWNIDDAGDADWSLQWKQHVADATVATHFAPVLAERDAVIQRLKDWHDQRDENSAKWDAYKLRKIQERRDHQKALADALGIEPDSRGMYPPIPELVARIAANTQYTETTRYHQQKHAEAVRELEKFRADRDRLLAEADQAATALAAIADRKVWEYPPSLGDRIELVASELVIARRRAEEVSEQLFEAAEKFLYDGDTDQPRPGYAVLCGLAEQLSPGSAVSGVGSQPDSEPRVWRDALGDPEPVEENLQLRDRDGGEYWFRGKNYWHGPYGYSLAWSDLIDQHGPLTEVVVDQPGGGGT